MSYISLEILIILVLIIANGVFSMSEMAIVSARKVRLPPSNQGMPRQERHWNWL